MSFHYPLSVLAKTIMPAFWATDSVPSIDLVLALPEVEGISGGDF